MYGRPPSYFSLPKLESTGCQEVLPAAISVSSRASARAARRKARAARNWHHPMIGSNTAQLVVITVRPAPQLDPPLALPLACAVSMNSEVG